MMTSWRKSWLCLIMVPLLFLQGCSLLEQPSSLIQEPDLTHQNRLLLSNVNRMLPEGARLISPASSSIKGRIMRLSLEKGDSQQAVFFYQTVEGTIHFSVINKRGNHWKKIYDRTIAANRQIKMALTNDGPGNQPELIMTTENTSADRITVYAMHGGHLETVLSSPFNGWLRGYFDQDGHPHLAFIVNNLAAHHSELVDNVMDSQTVPVPLRRVNLMRRPNVSPAMRHALRPFRALLTDPEISQLNELSGWEPGAVQFIRHYNSPLTRPFAGSAVHRWMYERSSGLFQKTTALAENYRLIRQLSMNPFYPLDDGMPAEERYYNGAHRFFIDFPNNTTGNLILSQEAPTHILFLRKDSGTPYISIYWIKRSHWSRGLYESWSVIGTSDHYIFVVPEKYKDAAAQIQFGVYDDQQGYED